MIWGGSSCGRLISSPGRHYFQRNLHCIHLLHGLGAPASPASSRHMFAWQQLYGYLLSSLRWWWPQGTHTFTYEPTPSLMSALAITNAPGIQTKHLGYHDRRKKTKQKNTHATPNPYLVKTNGPLKNQRYLYITRRSKEVAQRMTKCQRSI